MNYVDVILPLPLDSTFTYKVPSAWHGTLKIGMQVLVPFGSRKLYTALIYTIHDNQPTQYEAKEFLEILSEQPIVTLSQLEFWSWIRSYYQASLGEVYQVAVPSGLKIESETLVRLSSEIFDNNKFTAKEVLILDFLSSGKQFKVAELGRNLKLKDAMPHIKNLIQKGVVEVFEEFSRRFAPKTETYFRLSDRFQDSLHLQSLLTSLSRSKMKIQLIERYLDLAVGQNDTQFKLIAKSDFLANGDLSSAVLNSLVKMNIFDVHKLEATQKRIDSDNAVIATLNPYQELALNQIIASFQSKSVTLLHGVTSSGKTEIYMHLIQRTLQEGKQVLYLVPEIALTTQLAHRLGSVFGNRLGVYHSKFSDSERVKIWNDVLHNKGCDVILGARSSIFLPFSNLGLVIVDEEHESSFKQYDSSPRYHARNAAIFLASIHKANTLLGSATPSIESYHNAMKGKYNLVEINQRFKDIKLPEVHVVDLNEAYRKKQMQGHFTPFLIDSITTSLANKEQVILFQNRRGYAPFLECKSCGFVPKCTNCDVSLTVHKQSNLLKCHYCGYTQAFPFKCSKCNKDGELDAKGFGTEKIETEINQLFPSARVDRLDLDTTRTKKSYETIINNFEQHKIDILIGTQMVTKGLDFEHVSLVGILNADNMINFPDFRAHERAYQLMAQVGGRAGRQFAQGKVVIQTSQPEHPIICQVVNYDYLGMFRSQCEERKLFHYPPFVRIITVVLKHKDLNQLNSSSSILVGMLRNSLPSKILGPNDPIVSRVQNLYIKNIHVKVGDGQSLDNVKKIISQNIINLKNDNQFKNLWVVLDVDPM